MNERKLVLNFNVYNHGDIEGNYRMIYSHNLVQHKHDRYIQSKVHKNISVKIEISIIENLKSQNTTELV